ncbi:MAG: SusD/RagB family nutrient-binding outer membrane lipoprotein [Bacteroidota bacterium]
MRFNKKINILAFAVLLLSIIACDNDFEELNTDPVNPQVGTIEGFMAGAQYFEFTEPRFVAWRGNLLFTSHFSNQFSYGSAGDFFGEIDGYANNQGWTDATFDASYQRVSGNLRNLLGAYLEMESTEGVAVTRIMMSWFYQKMTDIYGDIPYSDVIGSELTLEVPLPTYDAQIDIYRGIINDLGAQIDAIGNSSTVIPGAAGDFIYSGDPQSWSVLANTMRLRLAIRSRDAFIRDGEQAFIDGIINDALSGTLIDETNEALILRSRTALVLDFLDGGFEDIFFGFGPSAQWVLADRYADMLNNTSDPRLFEMAVDSIGNPIDQFGAFGGASVVTRSGIPRLNLAFPSPKIRGNSLTDVEDQLPVMILSAAESYFLQAEAALLGFGGDANQLYQNGISASMNYWGVPQDRIDTYFNDQATAELTGTTEEQLDQIWEQRWLANLTNGYEAWALVRRTDIIPDVTDNTNFFVTPPNNGRVPRRLIYSTSEQASNETNVNIAIERQGNSNEMTNPVWWDVR